MWQLHETKITNRHADALKACSVLLFVSVMLGTTFCFASATNIYIAQNAAGAANGTDCADAYPVGFFNDPANWGGAASQIGPGTTVHLCGTITTGLRAEGSGISGNPIIVLFDSASHGQISMPAIPSSGAIALDNLKYVTVDGDGGRGLIQSTNNGSPSSLCSRSTYVNDIMSVGISANSASYIEVKNLRIGPLYVHVCTADDASNNSPLSPPGPVCVRYNGSVSNLTIDGNTMHDVGWCLWGGYGGTGTHNLHVFNNTIYNMDHGVGMGMTSGAQTASGEYIYGNSFYNASVWDTDDNSFHHDAIHLWAYCADGNSFCQRTYFQNAFIYNNRFYGTWGHHMTAFVFFEGNIQKAYVFNNLADGSQAPGAGDGLLRIFAANSAVFNNTLIGLGLTNEYLAALGIGGLRVASVNNLITTDNGLIATAANIGAGESSFALSHNIYANGGHDAFVRCARAGSSCDFYASNQFPNWESSSGETKSRYVSNARLNPDGTLAPGSAALGAGANLYSICNGQPDPGLGALCYDIAGNPRPASGNWDAGAYNSGSVAVVGQNESAASAH
jgi:hypothetical protein